MRWTVARRSRLLLGVESGPKGEILLAQEVDPIDEPEIAKKAKGTDPRLLRPHR
jgi:hypothetical protein